MQFFLFEAFLESQKSHQRQAQQTLKRGTEFITSLTSHFVYWEQSFASQLFFLRNSEIVDFSASNTLPQTVDGNLKVYRKFGFHNINSADQCVTLKA